MSYVIDVLSLWRYFVTTLPSVAPVLDGITLEKPVLKALRNQYGETLTALGAVNPNIVVLDADLACSTQTQLFADKYPDRFFNQGIAEQDLLCTAAGLSTTGKIPFVSTFALFATGRAWDQLRNTIAYSHLNVKICPTHSGLSLGEDGASHQSIEDIALTRVIPGMTVVVPSDAVETDAIIRWAADYQGPVYVRLVRPNCPVIHNASQYTFTPYTIETLRTGHALTLVATGETVYHALVAAEHLAAQHGIECDVLNVRFIKPLDVPALVASAEKTGKVLTVESHQVIGGLGGAVCEALSEHYPVPVKRLGTQDRFGQSGTGADLFKEYGIDSPAIVQAALSFVNQ
jgi:transketolase